MLRPSVKPQNCCRGGSAYVQAWVKFIQANAGMAVREMLVEIEEYSIDKPLDIFTA